MRYFEEIIDAFGASHLLDELKEYVPASQAVQLANTQYHRAVLEASLAERADLAVRPTFFNLMEIVIRTENERTQTSHHKQKY